MYQESTSGFGAAFWIVLIVVLIIVFIILFAGFIAYRYNNSSTSNGTTTTQYAQVGQRCESIPCAPGLICGTSSNGEKICMGLQGSSCRNTSDCAGSLVCNGGICAIPLVPPSNQTHVYSWNGSTWVIRYTLPQGITPTRISASGNTLLAISTLTSPGLVYYYNGNTWINLSAYYNAPGNLVDGTIANGNIYLVYRNLSGTTTIYQVTNFANGSGATLITLTDPVTTSSQPISINQIAVSPFNGDIFISGTIPGNSQVMIFRKAVNTSAFSLVTSGTNISTNPSGYAFSSGSSIIYVNEINSSGSNRVDGVSNILNLAVDNSNTIWYITNGQLYRQNQTIPPPTGVPVSNASYVYYSVMDGISFFTQGY